MTDGEMPGGTGTGGSGGDEAVWLDLVARFDAPAPEGEAPPWPDREDFAGPVPVTPVVPPPVPGALPGEPPTNPTGLTGLSPLGGVSVPDNAEADGTGQGDRRTGRSGPDDSEPDGMAADDVAPDGQPWPGLGAWSGPRDSAPVENPDDDHYVPPVPPPMPRLELVTKIAGLALFGGPLYLVICTAIGTPISALAAFLAVAAFVGGFVTIVLRMDNGRPPNSGSDDDGAVV